MDGGGSPAGVRLELPTVLTDLRTASTEYGASTRWAGTDRGAKERGGEEEEVGSLFDPKSDGKGLEIAGPSTASTE